MADEPTTSQDCALFVLDIHFIRVCEGALRGKDRRLAGVS